MDQFRYSIVVNDKKLMAIPIKEETVDKVIDFCQRRTINLDNYKTILGIGHEAIFSKKGALLETSREGILDVLEEPNKHFSACLWSEEEELLALIILQLEDYDNILDEHNFSVINKGMTDNMNRWKEGQAKNEIVYKGDIVVEENNSLPNLFHIIGYIAFKELLNKGKKNCLTETFNIVEIDDRSEHFKVNLFNKRSFLAQVIGAGAVYIGDGLQKQLLIGDRVTIHYYSKLLMYDLENTIHIVNQVLDKKKIEISKVI